MNNKGNNDLFVVGIEIPNRNTALVTGTKIKLSDGSYLRGIKSIKLETSSDNPLWNATLEVIPNFDNQDTIQAVLKELKVSGDETSKTTDQATDNHTEAT
ncbi:hypothetical protein [Acinetobacter bereziniae]|uniref:hypothetical protein n=1 Tax=Acinetobacter bereziniae TaxID=106648 RepID=UPI0015DA3EAA|nr:hypothetical protein [Acinetobacter bereziniae]